MNRANVSKKIVALVAIVMLVAILSVCLVACNQKDYEKRLKDKDYDVVAMTEKQISQIAGGDAEVEWAVVGTKSNGLLQKGEMVFVIKFKDTTDAKDCYEDFKDDKDNGYKAKRSGKIVIVGTEQGVKDAQ